MTETTEQTNEERQSKAREMLKAVHDDQCAEINGREYKLTKLTHFKRRKVFAFYSHVQNDLARGDFWFLESKDWAEIEKTIEGVVTFDGDLLSKRQDHWSDYPEDYLLFIQTMLGAISYPFLSGISGG